MPTFQDWLANFEKDKQFLAVLDPSGSDAVHNIRRYKDAHDRFWEVAITYTDRVVVRSGLLESNGVTLKWDGWDTHHDVVVIHNRSSG